MESVRIDGWLDATCSSIYCLFLYALRVCVHARTYVRACVRTCLCACAWYLHVTPQWHATIIHSQRLTYQKPAINDVTDINHSNKVSTFYNLIFSSDVELYLGFVYFHLYVAAHIPRRLPRPEITVIILKQFRFLPISARTYFRLSYKELRKQ